ncbi:MAG: septal ring lytic transglycosylase RlpA family lipoprotein [Massilia sp.]|nr:septal ring lytic transglycosylase RlpA family lipoprotein [Massilia sp.]
MIATAPRRAILAALAAALLVAGCGTTQQPHQAIGTLPAPGAPRASHPKIDPDLPALPAAGSGRGGYYKDDGPGDNPPPNLREVPDAVVKAEPLSRYGNRPYVVFGKTYTPLVNDAPFVQRGVASWYGKKFHGQRTSSGELYDMYKMTAAHPTLPIPSYARITSLATGKQVVVRINDRGPFHSSRIVDVSYTAALKLGLLGKGSHEVELERMIPGDHAGIATVRRNAPPLDAPAVPPEGAAPMLEDRFTKASDASSGPRQPAPGFYVQLGSYSRADKAAEARSKLLASGVLDLIEVVQAGAVHRLFGGPFGNREDALAAARSLPAALGIKPIVVRRGAD